MAIAGRVRPACSLSSTVDAAICAPVLPAEMNASDRPSVCSLSPTTIELFGLLRSAAVGLSDISMTSGASMISRRSAVRQPRRKLARAERGDPFANDLDRPDELKRVLGGELENGVERSGYRRIGGEVAPHRVQRDARQG